MKRTLLIILLGLTLTACGGGDSDTNEAAKPPAPEAPQNNGGGGGSGGGGAEEPAPQPEPELSLSCSPTPSGMVAPGGKATATFKFSQTYNGAGQVLYGATGGMANMDNVFINGNQLVVTRTVPDSGKYSIRLQVNGTDLTAVCNWNIGFELLIFNP